MSNQLAIIKEKLESKEVTNQLAMALNLDPGDEAAHNEARKYAGSVLTEVKRTAGASYGDLTKCKPDSVVMAMVDAANFKLQIDGRKLAFLESRWNKDLKCNVATLQINTNGFVAKIKETHPDAVFSMTPVFKGDKPPVITEKDGNKSYVFESKNPFGAAVDLVGILVSINYTDHGGRYVQDAQAVPIADLKAMQAQSKSKAWGTYTIERMKTAALKRACKWHFRQNATLQKLVDYDNTQNFDVAEPATPVRSSIIDNINKSVAAEPIEVVENEPEQSEPESTEIVQENDIQDAEFIEVEEIQEETDPELEAQLLNAGAAAAAKGWHEYKDWATSLVDAHRDIVRHKHADWTEEARKVTRAAEEEEKDESPPI